MGTKVKVKRKSIKDIEQQALNEVDRPLPLPPVTTWTMETGATVSVGDALEVKHYSSDSWQTAELKQITVKDEVATFHFYLATPGWVSLKEDRVKTPKPKKTVKVKKTKGE